MSQYKVGTDFTWINNNLAWISAGSQPTTGANYYVSYRKNKLSTAYNEPTIFYSTKDVRKEYPDLPLIVRARNRIAAYDLIDLGVKHIFRETFDTSLKAGETIPGAALSNGGEALHIRWG